MGRRYRRYKKSTNDATGTLAGALVLLGVAGIWQLQKENSLVLVYISVAAGVLLVLVGFLIFWKYRSEQRKLRALDIAAIDIMDPLEFERYVARLLAHQGFRDITLTERYDYGIDIVAKKNGITWGVQVKRYSNLVKAEAVRQTVTALIRYKCDRGMVVTNSIFSRPAKELANDNRCALIDREQLATWIVSFQGEGARK